MKKGKKIFALLLIAFCMGLFAACARTPHETASFDMVQALFMVPPLTETTDVSARSDRLTFYSPDGEGEFHARTDLGSFGGTDATQGETQEITLASGEMALWFEEDVLGRSGYIEVLYLREGKICGLALIWLESYGEHWPCVAGAYFYTDDDGAFCEITPEYAQKRLAELREMVEGWPKDTW